MRRKQKNKKNDKTRIVVHIEQHVTKSIYLRGEGISTLSWEKGVELNHQEPDEWVFETTETFLTGEFKLLINDQIYEIGESHILYPGASIRINPKFPESPS